MFIVEQWLLVERGVTIPAAAVGANLGWAAQPRLVRGAELSEQ